MHLRMHAQCMAWAYPKDHLSAADAAWVLQVNQRTLRALKDQGEFIDPSGEPGYFDPGRGLTISAPALRWFIERNDRDGQAEQQLKMLRAVLCGVVVAPKWSSPKGPPPPLTAYRNAGVEKCS